METFYNNPVYYYNTNPYFLCTKIDLGLKLQKQMIKTVESQIDCADYNGGYTFIVEELDQEFSKLYNTFENICKNIFEDLPVAEVNRRLCWANVYNKDTYRSNLHHHLRTSTINGVFYLKIPDDGKENSSGLRVITKDHLDTIFVPEELDLVIMPSWMLHEPLSHNSNENRIAINMEIACKRSIDNIYKRELIYKNCRINIE